MFSTRRFLQRSHFSKANTSRPAVAFDIDGVLIRGGMVLPPTKRALRRLRDHSVPFIFLTNGGGVPEAVKARQLSEMFDIDVSHKQVVLAHSPMQALPEKYPEIRDGLALIIGPDSCKEVALQYGFKKPVLPDEVVARYPEIWPFRKLSNSERYLTDINFESEPFKSVIVMHDSRDWGRDAQIACDVLRSDGGYLGTLSPYHHSPDYRQSVPVFFSNPDFIWSNNFPVPRFAQAAFRIAWEQLYRDLTDNDIEVREHCGKPFPQTYSFAERVLNELDSLGPGVKRHVYGIGDNIASDIVGANLARWHSILVRTGVWKDEDATKDIRHYYINRSIEQSMSRSQFEQIAQPRTIMDDVGEAVDFILRNEGIH